MFLAACFATCLAHVDARELRPPNILVIVSDNQGWKDIGYNGSEIRTPTLDRLADEGIRLDHFYVYPMCSPTRAAFVAGRAPSRFNINGAIGNRSRQSLPVDTVTIGDALRAVGYRTAITGKWHLGLRPEVGPLQYGFDSSYGYLHGQIDKLSHHYKNGDRSWHRDDRFLDEVGHSVDLITDEAIRVIGKKHDAAFFLYVPYGAPHPPLQEEERWTSIYDGTIESLSRREYAAAVTHMDHSIGRLIDALNQTGQRDDTLVVFFSDNGAIENWPPQPKNYAGRFGPYPVLGNNGHLRGWIGELYDGCVRTPAFVNWPGQLKPAVLDDVVSVLDLYPTLVSLAGGAIDDELQLEGRDIWPLLADHESPAALDLYWKSWNGTKVAVRNGKWKLHVDRSTQTVELYDMSNDPGEKYNIAEQHHDVVHQLRRILDGMADLDPH